MIADGKHDVLTQVTQHTSLDTAQQPIRFRLSKLGLPMSDHCRRRLLSLNQFSLASTPNFPYSQLVLATLWQLFYCIDYSKHDTSTTVSWPETRGT